MKIKSTINQTEFVGSTERSTVTEQRNTVDKMREIQLMILFKSDEKVVGEGVADRLVSESLASSTLNKETSSANGDTQSKVDDLYIEEDRKEYSLFHENADFFTGFQWVLGSTGGLTKDSS